MYNKSLLYRNEIFLQGPYFNYADLQIFWEHHLGDTIDDDQGKHCRLGCDVL
jgi:hypothetical protein